MQDQIKHLKGEIDGYKKEKDISMTGQAAFLFEHTICSHVLPEVYPPDSDKTASIPDLLDYLNGAKTLDLLSTKVLDEARQRLKRFCKDLNFSEEWTTKKGSERWWNKAPGTINAIRWLKKARVCIAHPQPVNLSKTEEKFLPPMPELSHADYPKYNEYQFENMKECITSMRTAIKTSKMRPHKDLIL